jgi:hypothetical protein
VPLLAAFALNFALGLLAARAAARELRASPRAVLHARAFRAVAVHEALVAVPVLAFLLLRAGDWSLSYLFDAARVPSVVVAALLLCHGGLALGGFALGARWLRDHRARWAALAAVACGAVVVLGFAAFRERLGVAGTYLQYRGGFGLRPLAHSWILPAALGLVLVWAAAGAHLLWSLARRPAPLPERARR